MTKIGIFASGSGTNAEKIMQHFERSTVARVVLVASDNPEAGVLERARRFGVPAAIFTRDQFADGAAPLEALRAAGVDYLVLAGFLRLVPRNIIEAYDGRIVNIHPALLPKFGGRGMYGDRVHRAVIEAGESESGITIHRVNERFDEGAALARFSCPVLPDDTPESLAERIHALEHAHFPAVIEQDILKIMSHETSFDQ